MVLLVVDTQSALVQTGLFAYQSFVCNIQKLIDQARKNQVEVVYVIHDDGAGSSLTRGREGFEVFSGFAPREGEKVFVKTVNSAFKDTGLAPYLQSRNHREILVTGLQTDKCIHATVTSGFERGFEMLIPAGANSTVDNPYMTGEESYHYYNDFMWPGRYARCISMEEALARMEAHGASR